ncbi:hypothetical protein F4780DRAFT_786502, partial [Xylariomycetidae sp. FL0641]
QAAGANLAPRAPRGSSAARRRPAVFAAPGPSRPAVRLAPRTMGPAPGSSQSASGLRLRGALFPPSAMRCFLARRSAGRSQPAGRAWVSMPWRLGVAGLRVKPPSLYSIPAGVLESESMVRIDMTARLSAQHPCSSRGGYVTLLTQMVIAPTTNSAVSLTRLKDRCAQSDQRPQCAAKSTSSYSILRLGALSTRVGSSGYAHGFPQFLSSISRAPVPCPSSLHEPRRQPGFCSRIFIEISAAALYQVTVPLYGCSVAWERRPM